MCYPMTLERWRRLSDEEQRFIPMPVKKVSLMELDRDPNCDLTYEEELELEEQASLRAYEEGEQCYLWALENGDIKEDDGADEDQKQESGQGTT